MEQKSKDNHSINNKQLLVQYVLVEMNFIITAIWMHKNEYEIYASQAALSTRIIQ